MVTTILLLIDAKLSFQHYFVNLQKQEELWQIEWPHWPKTRQYMVSVALWVDLLITCLRLYILVH